MIKREPALPGADAFLAYLRKHNPGSVIAVIDINARNTRRAPDSPKAYVITLDNTFLGKYTVAVATEEGGPAAKRYNGRVPGYRNAANALINERLPTELHASLEQVELIFSDKTPLPHHGDGETSSEWKRQDQHDTIPFP